VQDTPGQFGSPENKTHLRTVPVHDGQFMTGGSQPAETLCGVPGSKILGGNRYMMRIFNQGVSADCNNKSLSHCHLLCKYRFIREIKDSTVNPISQVLIFIIPGLEILDFSSTCTGTGPELN
jgi:hypothetical protein